MQSENENKNNSQSLENKLHKKFEAILGRPLIATEIDTYADKALDEVVSLSVNVRDEYDKQPTISDSVHTAHEDYAFRYFNLPDIDNTLDYLNEKSHELQNIDELIRSVPVLTRVIIPPSSRDSTVEPGEGGFEQPQHISRLKTLLFVLSNEFDIDIEDQERVFIQRGLVAPDMMRNESYYAVDIAEINRTVMICDASGNATFVFSRDQMRDLSISTDDLMGLTKPEINDLFEMSPGFGQKIIYTNNFVQNMVKTLGHIEISAEEAPSYLAPKPPEGYMNINALARDFSVSVQTIYRAIEEIGDDFGEVGQYVFTSVVTFGYSPEQQMKILDQLDVRGSLTSQPPEGYLGINGTAQLLEVSYAAVRRAIDVLREADLLGETALYKFKSAVSIGLSPDQQEVVRHYLEERGVIGESLPDGYITLSTMADSLNMSYKTIEKVLTLLGDELGNVGQFKVGGLSAVAYSPDQQELILQELDRSGYLVGPAPDGYESLTSLSEIWGLNPTTLQKAYAEIESQLGGLVRYRFGPSIAASYSPAQQQQLREYLESKNMFAEIAPEGYISLTSLGAELGLGTRVLKDAIDALGEDALGEIKIYKTEYRTVVCYSPDQQQLIRDYIEDAGYFNMMPDGYLTENGIATMLGVNNHTVKRFVGELGESLGEVKMYRTSRRRAFAYSPAQQSMIKGEMEAQGTFSDVAPEGYFPIIGIARALDTNQAFVEEAVKNLADSLGDVGRYKFGSTVTNGYSPEQQALVKNYLEARGRLAPRMPDGYVSIASFAVAKGFERKTIDNLIPYIEDFGTVDIYKSSGGNTEGLSPIQQLKIMDALEKSGKLSDPAPEGVLSSKSFALHLGIASNTLGVVVERLKGELGELKTYKFNNNTTIGFDEEQQRIIREHLDHNPPRASKYVSNAQGQS